MGLSKPPGRFLAFERAPIEGVVGSRPTLGKIAKQAFERERGAYYRYLLTHLLTAPYLGLRSLKRKKRKSTRGLMLRRLAGGTRPPKSARWVVLFARALGEVRLAANVAHELAEECGLDVYILVQDREGLQANLSGTPIGVAPFNNPVSAWLFRRRWTPRALLATEAWENHHVKALAAKAGIPTVVFNVQITPEETAEAAAKPESGWKWRLVSLYAVQDERHRERLRSIGVPEDRIRREAPIGMRLVDSAEKRKDLAEHWRGALGLAPSVGPVLVAGSTWRLDEEAVLTAFGRIRERFPNAVLVLAPRRADGLDEVLRARSVSFARRSRPPVSIPDSGVVLLDSRGELRQVYCVADAAFVGGTFDPGVGGHTPSEALSWHVPIVVGPYFERQAAWIEFLQSSGCLEVARNADELADALLSILSSSETRSSMAAAAAKVVDGQRGRAAEFWRSLNLT